MGTIIDYKIERNTVISVGKIEDETVGHLARKTKHPRIVAKIAK